MKDVLSFALNDLSCHVGRFPRNFYKRYPGIGPDQEIKVLDYRQNVLS